MILKGSQRAGGQNLAVHLMRLDDNEHIQLHELRGFVADDLKGAFKEVEAISLGTKCKQYLFSLSLSPPEHERVSVDDFLKAIDTVEERLGLKDQPRAIVQHEKNGRLHLHSVWSRIDAQTMTARPLPFFKNQLMEISRGLYLDHGWKMPAGMIDSSLRNPTNFTLAEWQRAKRNGIDPRLLKEVVQDCWKQSDNQRSFETSLEERGLFLARGDRRGVVLIDYQGDVHALARVLSLKTKDVRGRLGDGENLPSVRKTQDNIARRMTPAITRHVAVSKKQFDQRSTKLGEYKTEMTTLHRQARTSLDARLKVEWDGESIVRAARLPRGLRGIWHRITGQYQEVRRANEAEARATQLRHAQERQALIDKQRDQRAVLQLRFKELRKAQAELLCSCGAMSAATSGCPAPSERMANPSPSNHQPVWAFVPRLNMERDYGVSQL